MIDQENLKLQTGTEVTNGKSKSDGNVHNDKLLPENGQNKASEIEKQSASNPFDSSAIFFGLVWLGVFVKIYFYLTTKTPSLLMQTQTSTGGEYFTSIIRMKELAHTEQLLVAKMNEVVSDYSMTRMESDSPGDPWLEGLSKIKTYLRDYESSIQPMLSETVDIEETVVSHPLISFRMLRRVVINLPEIMQYNVDERLNDLINVAAVIEPAVTVDDVIGAVEGILRLQATFLISPSDLADGRLRNYVTNSGLTALDCFLIGSVAINRAIIEVEQFSTAVEWHVQALRMLLRDDENSEMASIDEVRKSLRNAIELHNKGVGRLPWTFTTAIDIKISEMTKVNENELMESFPSQQLPPPMLSPYELFGNAGIVQLDDINFKGLCRGEKLRNATMTKRLKCYYKTNNPFLLIKPLKVEVHSYDPLILQFYDIMPNYIINHFKTTTKHQLERALVASAINSKLNPSKYRISCSHFSDENADDIFSRLPKIIHEATGLNLLPNGSAEFSQISTYGAIGGFYVQHYDTLYDSEYTPFHLLDPVELSRGDRIATIMFYLSDVKLGGGTAFPRIGVLAQPIKNSAIFWYNLNKNGKRHPHTLHGGCPVLFGEKWVINKWIRSADQMFLRKCSLNSNN